MGEPRRARREGQSDAPEPTYSEARQRLPDQERTPFAPDADTKVERRASVRPSAFGAPRKSEPPASVSTSDAAPASFGSQIEPHERVLEAARLLDALDPALHEGEASMYAPEVREPVQRLANQRARGVQHLVERAAVEASAPPAPVAPASMPAAASVAPRAATGGSATASSAGKVSTRLVRRPWLSLLLFGGMVGLSVVPLLRYAESAEGAPGQAEPARAAALSAPSAPRRAAVPPPKTSASSALQSSKSSSRGTEPATIDSKLRSLDREQAISAALSEGTRALDSGDIGLAERMFGQVIELAEDDPHAAYGLARVRLRQNNLAGAEGWIQSALRKRPRRAAYHQLYAEVLTRMGRITEARDEQARAELHE